MGRTEGPRHRGPSFLRCARRLRGTPLGLGPELGWGRIGLIVLVLAIAGPLSNKLLLQLEEGKNVPVALPVTKAVARALFERVAQDDGVDIMFLARPRAEKRVVIHIASHDELPPSYATELRKITREAMDDPDFVVTVVAVRGLWRSESDPPQKESP